MSEGLFRVGITSYLRKVHNRDGRRYLRTRRYAGDTGYRLDPTVGCGSVSSPRERTQEGIRMRVDHG